MSTIERLGIVTAIAFGLGAVIGLLFTLSVSLHALAVGLMTAGCIYLFLGLAFGCESWSHHRRREVHFMVDRSGRAVYLPGASRTVAQQKHPEPPTPRMSRQDMAVLGFIFCMGIILVVAALTIHFLFLL
ncbi:MAG: hypothetical protein ACFFCO_08815 [Promethearchaeota archaeon]